MGTPLSGERKILSSYRDVARTFTYGIYATLPLFIVYQAGLIAIHSQKIISSNKTLEDASTLFGTLSHTATGLLLVLGMMAMLCYERRRFGFIQLWPPFFFLTAAEAVFFAVALGYVSSWLPFPLQPEPLINAIIYGAGAGFYEELLNRVILLGGLLAFFRAIRFHGMSARIIAVTLTAMLFSLDHYTGPLGEHLALGSFLYRSYAGVFFSYLYLQRGFATVAWTHSLFDIFAYF
jgi:hypothetical protein